VSSPLFLAVGTYVYFQPHTGCPWCLFTGPGMYLGAGEEGGCDTAACPLEGSYLRGMDHKVWPNAKVLRRIFQGA
jgi:hypothetical protein